LQESKQDMYISILPHHYYFPCQCLFLSLDHLPAEYRNKVPRSSLWFKPRYFIIIESWEGYVILAPLSTNAWGGENHRLFSGERRGQAEFTGPQCYVVSETMCLPAEQVEACRHLDRARGTQLNYVLPGVRRRIVDWLSQDSGAAWDMMPIDLVHEHERLFVGGDCR
jgi:hypothetical protein